MAKHKFYFRKQFSDVLRIDLDHLNIAHLNHGCDGWNCMEQVEKVVTAIAEALKIPIKIIEE